MFVLYSMLYCWNFVRFSSAFLHLCSSCCNYLNIALVSVFCLVYVFICNSCCVLCSLLCQQYLFFFSFFSLVCTLNSFYTFLLCVAAACDSVLFLVLFCFICVCPLVVSKIGDFLYFSNDSFVGTFLL